MGFLLESLLAETLCTLFLIVWLFYWYLTKNYDYWKIRGVPYKSPQFPFGSTKEIALAKCFIAKAHDNIYKQFQNQRFYGIIEFRTPSLVVRDPDLIKRILIKDFQHFVDRSVIVGNPKEHLMMHLFNLVGQKWKNMRNKLTPTFTSGKMKMMFQLVEKCGQQLKSQLEVETKGNKTINVKNILSRFTMDIIATCAFGLQTNALANKDEKFLNVLGKTMNTTRLRLIRRHLFSVFPFMVKVFQVNIFSPELRDFVTNLVRDTIEYRKTNNVKREDFLDLLINLKHNKNDLKENRYTNSESTKGSNENLTVEEIAAQTFLFFVAGFETSTSTMSFCLYELSIHQDIQEKLFQEIYKTLDKNEGNISYQMLMQIPFLDQIINETLRLYGGVHFLNRECTESYKIPDSNLVLEKGVKVIIPIYSLHHDPEFYSDPYDFKPERFTPEESMNRHPCVFMPFGEGPRNCIGMRFGLMQVKVGLVTVISNYHVALSADQEVPIEIHNKSVAFTTANPVLLKLTKRNCVQN